MAKPTQTPFSKSERIYLPNTMSVENLSYFDMSHESPTSFNTRKLKHNVEMID